MSHSSNISNDFITSPYYIEGLYIEPSQSIIIENNETRHIQPKVMEVLTYLCSKAEQLVSTDELIKACWPNQYISDSPLHKCIAQIRKTLADDPKNPRFIKTVPKKGYVFIAKVKGLNITPQQAMPPWSGEPPYPGLKPYTFTQNNIFFGRDQIIADINNWAAQINRNEATWLSLSSPVGAGKSSLVYAGLLPTLISHAVIDKTKQDICTVIDLASVTASTKPHIYLLECLLSKKNLSTTLSLQNYADLISAQIEKTADSQTMTLFQTKIVANNNHSRFVLFVDHLEMLFDYYSPIRLNEHEHACFFLLLQLLVRSKKCFLITAIREQFLPELAQTTIEYKQAFQYKIPTFSHTELIDIIEKPAILAGINFEYNDDTRERLNSVIIQQLQIKPVPIGIVQFLLAQLYAQKSEQLITYKAYKKIGGIAGCLATIAEQNYQHLSELEQTSFEQILFRILTLSANGQIATSEQPCPIKHFTDKNKLSVIGKFINVGIFQLICINQQTCVYLAHYSLLTTWTRISLWIKANISNLYIRHDLKIASQRWLYHEKSSHLLIHSNKKIKKINRIIDSNDFSINADEKALIALSMNKITRTNRFKKAVATTFFISFIGLAWLSVALIQTNEQVTTARNNAESLISFIIYDLKDKLEPLGKLELLNMVAGKTLDYFELAGTENLTGTALLQWTESLHILGAVNISKNNYNDAESYFKQTAVALKYALAKDKNNEQLLALTMLTNYWLGYSAYLQVDYDTAEPFWINYKNYADKLFLLFPKPKWQLEQSYALNNLGSLAEKNNHLTVASNYFEQSAQIKLALLETQPDNLIIRADLADTRSWQSNIQAKSGKLFNAINYLQDALKQVKNIYSTEHSFKNIETISELEHKIALLYYDVGDLEKAQVFSQKAKGNIIKLVRNDEENYLFKKDLLWSQLLSIQVFINQNKLDQALTYIDKAKKLINILKGSSTDTIEAMRANIYLLQQRARIRALLEQDKSALMAITEAIKLFKQHLSVNFETSFYARIMLTKLSTIHNADTAPVIYDELAEIKKLLENKLQASTPDYKAISIYLTTINFMKQLPLGKHLQSNHPWLKLYQASDYNIPEHSRLSITNNRKKKEAINH
ncbi:MAG: winged helix-turn-helix domain-containing protein [Colwellia sp.]|nr:winged helix-turn-helix domain-containing protein [Colwellia sp.]